MNYTRISPLEINCVVARLSKSAVSRSCGGSVGIAPLEFGFKSNSAAATPQGGASLKL